MSIDERDRNLLIRIGEHCERIMEAQQRFGDSLEAYLKDADYRDVVCMNIFQIGELSNQISDKLHEQMNDIPWHQMYGIRNILAHAYIKIEDGIVWQTVKNDIPVLKERIDDMV